MEQRVKGLVLRTVDMGETDRLLTILTPDKGKVTAKVRGCRSAKSKLRYAAQPMCLGEYILTETKGGLLVTACDQIENFAAVSEGLDKYYVAAIALEVAEKLSAEDRDESAVFVCILDSLKRIAYEKNALAEGVRLLGHMLTLAGHKVRAVCECGEVGTWLDMENACVCCDKHKGMLDMPIAHDWAARLTAAEQGADMGKNELRDLYVGLARVLWHTCGCKLNSVQELCKLWDVL